MPADTADGTARSATWQPAALLPRFKSQPLECGLYVIATPIGNLMDITLRALDALSQADLVACEDTRITGKLLAHFGLSPPMVVYNDHTGAKARPKLMDTLRGGGRIALVSDAGTPLISDPGFKLVQACVEAGYRVVPVPGASALLAGVVVSALPTDNLMFVGFLPPKSKARRDVLTQLAAVDSTLVFYESGPRAGSALKDMAEVLGDRRAAVARELTKLYEDVTRGPLSELAAAATKSAVKGELVIVVGPPGQDPRMKKVDLDQALKDAMASMSVRDAAATVAVATGVAKKDVYSRALTLAAEEEGRQ